MRNVPDRGTLLFARRRPLLQFSRPGRVFQKPQFFHAFPKHATKLPAIMRFRKRFAAFPPSNSARIRKIEEISEIFLRPSLAFALFFQEMIGNEVFSCSITLTHSRP